jgi:transcriptional regulator with XRE-family HTH domain
MKTTLDELMQDPEFRREFAVEGFIAETAQVIWDLMEQRNMKQADVARLLKKTPAFVSQLLNGKANMTVRTLAEVAYALGATVSLKADSECSSSQLAQESESCHTFHFHETHVKNWSRPQKGVMSFGKIEGGRNPARALTPPSDDSTISECVA